MHGWESTQTRSASYTLICIPYHDLITDDITTIPTLVAVNLVPTGVPLALAMTMTIAMAE